MRDLSPGWATDLAILKYTGSTVEDRGNHLLVRTPNNPGFHWGNCLFVTDEQTVDDAQGWVDIFHAAFPSATWVAIGLTQMPNDVNSWARQGLELELEDVLTTRTMPLQTPLAGGYTVRQLNGSDWEQTVLRDLAENQRTAAYEPHSYERFVRAQMQTRRSLCDRDVAAFFGAFTEDRLVADLGIVLCGSAARYQSVGTDANHRRRGLASHLLGLAARWAVERGAQQWVIVTEATNPAGLLYRSVGFEPDSGNAQAYRRPSKSAANA